MNLFALRFFSKILGMTLGFCVVATLVWAASLQDEVSRKNTEAAKRKKGLQALSDQERVLNKDLAKLEKSIADAVTSFTKLEAELEALKKDQGAVQARFDALLAERAATSSRLEELMQTLWPIYLQAREEGFPSAEKWAEANRKAQWLAALYQQAQEIRAEIERQSQIVADEQSRLDETAAKLDAHLEKTRASQASLQKKQAEFEAQLKSVRSKRAQGEKDLQNLMNSITALRHKISLEEARKEAARQAAAKQAAAKQAAEQAAAKQAVSKQSPARQIPKQAGGGQLPWPAQGKLVTQFAPKGHPPSNGIGLALAPGAPVRSVAWGKIVHNGQLRGFGQVVVVFHGDDHYSLYAFLSKASVEVGKEIKQGEQLGVCGFYPQAQGPGLYFELRFGQKAISPFKWLKSG